MEEHELKPQETAPAPRGENILLKSWKMLSGKEIPKLVEEFTREMVVVAEGLSEDQARLTQAVAEQARGQDDAAGRIRAMEKQLGELSRQVADLSKKAEKRQKGDSNLTRILRQATWLAGIIAGAWIITTLLRMFGG